MLEQYEVTNVTVTKDMMAFSKPVVTERRTRLEIIEFVFRNVVRLRCKRNIVDEAVKMSPKTAKHPIVTPSLQK